MAAFSIDEALELFRDSREPVSDYGGQAIVDIYVARKDVEGLCSLLSLLKLHKDPKALGRAAAIFFGEDYAAKALKPNEPPFTRRAKDRINSFIRQVLKGLVSLGAREAIPALLEASAYNWDMEPAIRGAVTRIRNKTVPLQRQEGSATLFSALPAKPQPLQLMLEPPQG